MGLNKISYIMPIIIVEKDYDLSGLEKWAGLKDVEKNLDDIKEIFPDAWAIVAFKMRNTSKFGQDAKGYAKLAGAGYGWDIKEDIDADNADECGQRFVLTRGDDDSDSSSDEEEEVNP